MLIEPKTNKPLIMILATLLAAMLAGLFVLMRHFIRARSISEI
jgi:LPS O-antigen subunit length determinant protein (WzzB/FepE family)